MIPSCDTTPIVGLSPTIKLLPAGHTIEPSVSVPTATEHKSAVDATAEPELPRQPAKLVVNCAVVQRVPGFVPADLLRPRSGSRQGKELCARDDGVLGAVLEEEVRVRVPDFGEVVEALERLGDALANALRHNVDVRGGRRTTAAHQVERPDARFVSGEDGAHACAGTQADVGDPPAVDVRQRLEQVDSATEVDDLLHVDVVQLVESGEPGCEPKPRVAG